MKWFISLSLLVSVIMGVGSASRSTGATPPISASAQSPALVARLYCVGWNQISRETNGTVFKEIWKLPVTARLREETLDKLATTVAASFHSKSPKAATSCAHLIRPLFDDLCAAETFLEIFEHVPGHLEATVAAHLDESRIRVWQSTLEKLASDWQANDSTLSFAATNSWVSVHISPASAQPISPDSAYRRLQQGRSPVSASSAHHWLRLEADLARWNAWFSAATRKDLPSLDLTMAGRKEYLRTEARITFREPLRLRSEKWEIPMATIRDPLISFTALQGIAPWLSRQPFVQALGLKTVPDQLYLWALSQTAFQIQAAVPVSDAGQAFAAVSEKWVPKWNQVLATNAVGQFRALTNRTELAWRGLPIIVPYLSPVQDNGRDYLRGGIFPVSASTNPPPPALFQQLTSQNNLLYYDWEITQARLDQLRPLLQLAAVFLTISPMSTNSSAYQWLDAAGPRLGNSVTEMALVSPRELSLVRTSHLGFNGAELLTLANWLEGTNFPQKLNLEVNFRPVVKPNRSKVNH